MKNFFCPICAVIVIVWLAGLLGLYLDARWANQILVALLMGGSIGAFAEKYGDKMGLIWKILFIVIGFSAVYFLVSQNLNFGLLFGIAIVPLAVLAWLKKEKPKSNEDIFKNCC